MRLMSFLLVVALTGSAGCSAGRAAVALAQADSAITNARSLGAEDEAAYELRMAQAYLIKAREEAHFSSYRSSVELSRGAADWADKAVIEMQEKGTATPDPGAFVQRDLPGEATPTPAPTPGPTEMEAPEVEATGAEAPEPAPPTEVEPAVAPAPEPTGPVEPDSQPTPPDAAPPKVIVVPVAPSPTEPAPPRVRIVPKDPPPSDETESEDEEAP